MSYTDPDLLNDGQLDADLAELARGLGWPDLERCTHKMPDGGTVLWYQVGDVEESAVLQINTMLSLRVAAVSFCHGLHTGWVPMPVPIGDIAAQVQRLHSLLSLENFANDAGRAGFGVRHPECIGLTREEVLASHSRLRDDI